ncbi:MAG: septum formation protein Maf [Coriobacteriaceae bacterium]|nr:septum formation protein Maf [Coriobacteriaceae bacterium]
MIKEVVLASGSPRRRELLAQAGVRFQVFQVKADESLSDEEGSDAAQAAETLAERKAGAAVQTILAQPHLGMTTVIGADTMVVLDGKIYGKPRSAETAQATLRALSGKTHQVITGVSVWRLLYDGPDNLQMGRKNFHVTSNVTFRELTDEEIAAYVRTGESRDKAGAYGIQGEGAKLVAGYEGDYDNIVGLPVTQLLELFPDLLDD